MSAALELESIGKGPELVLLHSLLSDRSAYDRVKAELAGTFRLHLFNLPGYGGSKSEGEDTIDAYAERLAAHEVFAGKPALLGNGFGGFVALALAIRHPGKVSKLIAAPALAGFPPQAKEPFRIMAAKVRESGMQAVLDAAIQRMFPPAFIAAHPDVVAERKAALAKADPQSFARACLALSQLDLKTELGKIKNKTLVLVGTLDQTTPAALARELANGIAGAQFQELPGCGHCPQIEQPDPFVAALRGFLT
ncbi:MAG TPA: alpha/beta fold hydrolase [Burkholderiales bacterium]|nr:alpha/beta fold hydrolase [Burkholderiales bacterium]